MSEILIVDDDRAARTALHKRLSASGYRVIEASNGQHAIKQFEKFRPSVVFLDASMPDVSGFDVCRHIRAADPERRTRVFFLSGASTPSAEYVARCAEAHDADGYLRKPYDFDELLNLVDGALAVQDRVEAC